MKNLHLIPLTILLACTGGNTANESSPVGTFTGTFERLDPAFDAIVSPDAKAEIIAEGFEWSEGSLWVESQQMLLFSDVPTNTIYKWTEKNGKEIYLTPSGYTGTSASDSREPGSNGLTLDPEGNLVLCQHGDRRVSRMEASFEQPAPSFVSLASTYSEKRFSSPNDAVFNKVGELFFTDPPYGLKGQDQDSTKEISFNGVYKVKTDGTVILLVDTLTRPNGIALFPDEKRLLVANSDPGKANWYVFDIAGDSLTNAQIFFSEAGRDPSWKGLPDGVRIDSNGNVFATGPGGLSIFNKEGKKLGMLRLDNPTSNCALSPDEKTLYITNDMYVLRVKLR